MPPSRPSTPRTATATTPGGWFLLAFGALCLVVGHWHGRLLSNQDNIVILPGSMVQGTNHRQDPPTTSSNSNSEWKRLEVYVGPQHQNQDGITHYYVPTTNPHYAQARQDEAIVALLGLNSSNSKHADDSYYFVDLAANHATNLSNTYWLERHWNWKGLCIEPNPIYWKSLMHHRPSCTLVGAVVAAGHRQEEPQQQPMPFLMTDEHGGLIGHDFDNGPKRHAHHPQAVLEWTVALEDIFRRYHVPARITYLSLDVEGAEGWVLHDHFPFDQYQFDLLTIERPKPELRALLEANQYQHLCRLSKWGDLLWAHKSVIPALHMERLDEFDIHKIREKEQQQQRRQRQ